MVKTPTGFIHSSRCWENFPRRAPFSCKRKRRKEPSQMATRIYVGGLPYSASEQDLEKLFSASGTVNSVNVITDKYTGQAKGFGFVEMSTDAEASTAINALNGTMMD